MATLPVRQVPEETCAPLRRLAAQRKSSINAEAVRLLARAVRTDTAAVRAPLDRIEIRRPVARRRALTAAALIRRDRDAR